MGRSPAWGKESPLFARALRILLSVLILLFIVGVPLGYSVHRKQNFRNLRVVEDGVLYRSGQLSRAALERVINDYGIRTVVSLRGFEHGDGPAPDYPEELWCRKEGIKYVRLPPRKWWAPDGGVPPAQQNVDEFLRVMDDRANYPVLVHSFAGIHRTGAHVAVYRMEMQRWTNAEALDELRWCGYRNLDNEEDVLGYLESYAPRWKRSP